MATNPAKVLIIEDNRVEARLVQKWLSPARGGTFDLEVVDRVSYGLDRLERGGIDIVLLDLNLPDSRGLETFTKVREGAPDVPVVVLTNQTDEALGIQAVEQGAQDYLVKNKVNAASVMQALQFALARHKGEAERLGTARGGKGPKVLGFMGVKGGAGTTTVALNVALALTKQSKSVIAVELRPSFGTLALQLQEAPAKNLSSLLELAPDKIDQAELTERLCKCPSELRVLFGPQKVSEFKEIGPEQAEAIINGLGRMADCVVLDLPCHPLGSSQAAARLCHFIALVAEREPNVTASARIALDILRSWGVGISMVGAVIVNKMSSWSPTKLPEVRPEVGCDLVGVIPPAPESFLRSQESGVPLVLSEPQSLPAISFIDLADRLAAEKVVAMKM